jgi:hypothetical protein
MNVRKITAIAGLATSLGLGLGACGSSQPGTVTVGTNSGLEAWAINGTVFAEVANSLGIPVEQCTGYDAHWTCLSTANGKQLSITDNHDGTLTYTP